MIPPGPQVPFSKERSYGQEPGFVSRNMRLILVVLALLVVGAIVLFMSAAASRSTSPAGRVNAGTPTRQ